MQKSDPVQASASDSLYRMRYSFDQITPHRTPVCKTAYTGSLAHIRPALCKYHASDIPSAPPAVDTILQYSVLPVSVCP